jgi:predicted nucleic acid-binding protein
MAVAGSVLLDTNIVVAHFRNDQTVTVQLRAAPAIFVPWVVLGELHYGALRAQSEISSAPRRSCCRIKGPANVTEK